MPRGREKLKLPKDGSVQEALGRLRVRDGSVDPLWLVIGYSNQNTLAVVAEGKGGLSEAAEHCPPNECRYIMLRKAHQVELATTIKFAFIDYTPDAMSPMRKALLTTHKGQAGDIFAPNHVQLKASVVSELDDDVILDKIGFSSGTKIHMTTKQSSGLLDSDSRRMTARHAAPHKEVKASDAPVNRQVLKSRRLAFSNEEDFTTAMAALRSDADSTNWLLVDYESTNILRFVGSGSGGVSELSSNMPADAKTCFYAMFRVDHKIDNSITVKFGFVKKLSPGMSPKIKAQISTHRGFVVSKFEPFHLDFDLDASDPFTEEMVTRRVEEVSLTRNNVVDSKNPNGVPEGYRGNIVRGGEIKRAGKRQDHVNTKSRGLKFTNQAEFKAALADVRSDRSETTWMLCGYPSKSTLTFLASGAGEVDELCAQVAPRQAFFGLVRVTDQIDNSTTVKFVFIKIQPDNMSPTMKGSLTLIKGALDDLFAPFHVDFTVNGPSELTHSILMDKVGRASGTANLVRERT